MSTLTMERHFAAAPEIVFDYLTRTEHIAKWWGPEGMTCPVLEMDLTQPGPWVSEMMNADGARYKVSGEVLTVDPPRTVEFTWGWHDEANARGHGSTVHFTVESDGKGGTRFTLTHTGLADEESAENHNGGWTSSLRKIERLLND